MDPIRNLCIVKNSFENKTINKIPKYSEKTSQNYENLIGSPRARRKFLLENKTDKEIIIDDIIIPNEIADPYINMDSFFKLRSSLVLADIDSIFNFSRQEDGYILPQVINMHYKYAILGKDKGFLQYMQYRLPASTGFIGCLDITKDEKISLQFLNQNCSKDLEDYVLNIEPEGVNLVISNELNENKLIQALKLCDVNATFITKIDNNTPIEYLYTIAMTFKTVSLIKPFLENLNEKNSYFIAEGFQGNSLDVVSLEFLKINVPNSFYSYVQNYYNSIKLLKNSLPKTIKYNLYKCKAILNLF